MPQHNNAGFLAIYLAAAFVSNQLWWLVPFREKCCAIILFLEGADIQRETAPFAIVSRANVKGIFVELLCKHVVLFLPKQAPVPLCTESFTVI